MKEYLKLNLEFDTDVGRISIKFTRTNSLADTATAEGTLLFDETIMGDAENFAVDIVKRFFEELRC